MAALFNSMDWVDEENDLSTVIGPDRNALGDDLIEALECLKAWWDNGLVLRH